MKERAFLFGNINKKMYLCSLKYRNMVKNDDRKEHVDEFIKWGVKLTNIGVNFSINLIENIRH
jgi:hypothetical protein